jgi:hypothetical protein
MPCALGQPRQHVVDGLRIRPESIERALVCICCKEPALPKFVLALNAKAINGIINLACRLRESTKGDDKAMHILGSDDKLTGFLPAPSVRYGTAVHHRVTKQPLALSRNSASQASSSIGFVRCCLSSRRAFVIPSSETAIALRRSQRDHLTLDGLSRIGSPGVH